MEPLDSMPVGMDLQQRRDRRALIGIITGAITGAIAMLTLIAAVVFVR